MIQLIEKSEQLKENARGGIPFSFEDRRMSEMTRELLEQLGSASAAGGGGPVETSRMEGGRPRDP